MKDKLPRSWEEKKLEEITSKPQYGYTASASFDKIGPKLLRITDITDGKIDWKNVPYCSCDEKEFKKYQLKKDDLLFARTGSTGSSILIKDIPEPSVFASYLIRLKIKGKIEPDYLNHFFQSWYYWKQIESLKVGAVQSGINASVLSSLKVPVPPLVEQHGIVEVLGCVDECIRLTDEVIGAAEELKRGLMQRLLTQGIGHTEYKQTPLGKIPKIWNVINFGQLIKDGPQNGIYKHSSEYGSGVYILRINNFDDGKIINYDFKRVKVNEKEMELYKLNINDIVINRVNSLPFLGKTTIIPIINEDIIFESNMMRLKVDEKKIFPEYANMWLCSYNAKRQLWRKAKRAVAQSSINQQDVASVKISIPPLLEQKKIMDVIYSQEDFIYREMEKRAALDHLKQGMMQSLLSGKVRVELREDGLHRVGDSRETHN